MGKNTSQRTKGNTKPSNSLRSAQLLSSNIANPLNAFIGFDSTKLNLQNNRNLIDSEDIDQKLLDQDLLLVLKQLSKKDSITKIKVLNKFSEICKIKEVNLIKPILPKWTRVFNKLALDYDFRVREACFKAHEMLIVKVGKNIAPHLKQMMAAWILCLHDPYPLPSLAANSSFHSAFSPCKQPEALSYCRNEIINYAQDILLFKTPQSIDNKSTSNDEERKAQYLRLVCCSLGAIHYLLTEMQNPEMIKDSMEKILQNDKFWKLEKYEDNNVKINWYKLKTALCYHLPELTKKFGEKLTLTCLNNINEKCSTLTPYIWENLLWTLKTVDDCWSYINFQKNFIPQLKVVLQEAGHGNVSSIYPNLLPLLSKLPIDKMKDPINFYVEFLDSFETGFFTNNFSSKNFFVISKHYFECIWYFIKEDQVKMHFKKEDSELDKFFFDRFNSTIDLFLKEWKNDYSYYFMHFTSFLKKLYDYDRHKTFVELINLTFMRLITQASSDMSFVILLPKLLSSVLKINFKKVEKTKVKFGEPSQISNTDVIDPEIISIYSETLNLLWSLFLKQSAAFNQNTNWLFALKNIQQILIPYKDSLNISFENFEDYLMDWLKNQIDLNDYESKKKNIRLLIEMIFNCFSSSFNTLKMLQFLAQFNHFVIFIESLEQLKKKMELDQTILDWLKTNEANEMLLNAILKLVDESNKNVLSNEVSSLQEYLKFFLKLEQLNPKLINKIIITLKDSLDRKDLTFQTIELICDLSKGLIDSKNNQLIHIDLIKSYIVKIFSKSLNFNDDLDIKTCHHLTSTWFASLQCVSSIQSYQDIILILIQEIKRVLKTKIISDKCLKNLIYNSKKLIENYCFKKIQKPSDFEKNDILLKNMLLICDDWINVIHVYNPSMCFSFWIKATLPVPIYINFNLSEKVESSAFFVYIQFTLQILEFVYQSCNCLQLNQAIVTQLPYLLFAHLLFESSLHYKSFIGKEEFFQNLNKFLKCIIKTMKDSQLNELIEIFKNFIENDQLSIGLGFCSFLKFYQQPFEFETNFDSKKIEFASIAFLQLTSKNQNLHILAKIFEENVNFFLKCEDYLSYFGGLGHLEVINVTLSCDCSLSFSHFIEPLLKKLKEIKNNSEELFLFNWNLENVKPIQFTFAISLVNTFVKVLEKFKNKLNDCHKDTILVSLTSWLIAISDHFLQEFNNPHFMIFTSRVLQLFFQVSLMMSNETDSKTLDEWKNFHLICISKSLIPLFLKLKDIHFFDYQNTLVLHLGKCISSLPSVDVKQLYDVLPKLKQKDESFKEMAYPISEELSTVLFNLNSGLLVKYPFYLSAHSLIRKMLPNIIQSDLVFGNKDNYLTPPWPFLYLLKETDAVLDTMLADYVAGDTCCLIKSQTDSFSYTIAYLFNWIHILNFFSYLKDENRQMLASYLTEFHYIYKLFNNIFRLMPLNSNLKNKFNMDLIKSFSKYNFLEDYNEDDHIQILSYILYYNILRKIPACLRLWFINLDKRVADLFSSFTKTNFSELICEKEFKAIQQADMSKFKNMVVKSRSNAREVLAMYSIEEMSIELAIKLPENHPLGNLVIDVGKRKGVSNAQWRKWHLQLTTFLTHQNGSILDGLMLWKSNLDKKFEGLQECVICFYILHGTNYQTPKLSCKNCKNKFHSACLYKWFQKSNKSTCPYCVTVWH